MFPKSEIGLVFGLFRLRIGQGAGGSRSLFLDVGRLPKANYTLRSRLVSYDALLDGTCSEKSSAGTENGLCKHNILYLTALPGLKGGILLILALTFCFFASMYLFWNEGF